TGSWRASWRPSVIAAGTWPPARSVLSPPTPLPSVTTTSRGGPGDREPIPNPRSPDVDHHQEPLGRHRPVRRGERQRRAPGLDGGRPKRRQPPRRQPQRRQPQRRQPPRRLPQRRLPQRRLPQRRQPQRRLPQRRQPPRRQPQRRQPQRRQPPRRLPQRRQPPRRQPQRRHRPPSRAAQRPADPARSAGEGARLQARRREWGGAV